MTVCFEDIEALIGNAELPASAPADTGMILVEANRAAGFIVADHARQSSEVYQIARQWLNLSVTTRLMNAERAARRAREQVEAVPLSA